MGVMDKFLNAMKLYDDDGTMDGYQEDYLDDEEVVEPQSRRSRGRSDEDAEYDERSIRKPAAVTPAKVTPIRQMNRRNNTAVTSMEVRNFKPTTYEEVTDIADALKAGHIVSVNLSGLDTILFLKIQQFVCGTCYALGGDIQEIIENVVFIVTPANVRQSNGSDLMSDSYDNY